MKPHALLALGFLLALPFAAAGGDPAAPAAAGAEPQRQHMTIDGVPDTGQFLPDTALLARVGDKTITVGDFVETFFNSYAPDRPKGDRPGRIEWLESMVNKEILARTAREANYQPDFAERTTLRAWEQRVLANVLYLRTVSDSVQVTEAEINDLYEHTKREYHLQHVLCVSKSTADSVYTGLRSGKIKWREAVQRFSIARADSNPDGDLGWGNLISMSPDMTFGLIALSPGDYTKPVADRDGWHIVKLIGTRPAAEIHISAIRSSLVNKVRLAHEGARIRALTARLRESAGLVYDEANILWASSRFAPTRSTSDEGGVLNLRFNTRLPVFAPTDTGRVLARYKDGTLTLSRFLYEYGQITGVKRPSVDSPESFRDQIDTIVLEPYRAIMARDLGLGRDPLAVSQVAKRLEQMQVEHLYRDSVEARVQVTVQEIRKYYDAKPAGFTTFPKVRYAILLAPTRKQADSLVAVLKTGPDVEAMVKNMPTRDGRKQATIKEESDQEHGTYHALLFEEMKPGQSYVDGPDSEKKFAVIHMMSFDPGHLLSFAEARGYAEDAVRAEKAEQVLKAFIERHKRGVPVTLLTERVDRIRLMDPAAYRRNSQ